MLRSIILPALAAAIVLSPMEADARRGGGWGGSITSRSHDRAASSVAPDRRSGPESPGGYAPSMRASVIPFTSTVGYGAAKAGEAADGAASAEPSPAGVALGGSPISSTPLRGTRGRAEFCADGVLASNAFCVLN